MILTEETFHITCLTVQISPTSMWSGTSSGTGRYRDGKTGDSEACFLAKYIVTYKPKPDTDQ